MLDKFLTTFKKTGFSKPYLFEIIIPRIVLDDSASLHENIKLYAKTASIPSQLINQIQVPFQGRLVKLPGEKQFQDWTVTIINDEGYTMRNFFEGWAEMISSNKNAERNNQKILADLLKDIQVTQLDTGDKEVQSYVLINAFPINIGPAELNWESINSTQDFTVTFAYQYFDTDYIKGKADSRVIS